MRHTRATRTRGASRGDSGLQRSSVKYPRAGPGTRSVSSVGSSKVARCMSRFEPERSRLSCVRKGGDCHNTGQNRAPQKPTRLGEPSSIYCKPTLNPRPHSSAQHVFKGMGTLSHQETLPLLHQQHPRL